VLRTTGRYSEGEECARRAVEILEPRVDARSRLYLSDALHTLASTHADRHDFEGAANLHSRSLAMREELLGADDARVAATLIGFATVRKNQERYTEAERLLVRAIGVLERTSGDNHPDIAVACNNLAQVYKATGRLQEAEPLYRRALAVWEHRLGAKHPDYALGLANLADLFRLQGKLSGAARLIEQALGILEPNLGVADMRVIALQRELGRIRIALDHSRQTVDVSELSRHSVR
jgi:tetratricopeptide (TPR) repeat protein